MTRSPTNRARTSVAISLPPRTRARVAERIAPPPARSTIEESGHALLLAVQLRQMGHVIGDVMLHWASREHGTGEVGYVFNPNYVAALDRPDPLRPGLRIPPHRGVAGLVGAEPTAPSSFSWPSTTSMVADSLWGSTPMITLVIAFSCFTSYQ